MAELASESDRSSEDEDFAVGPASEQSEDLDENSADSAASSESESEQEEKKPRARRESGSDSELEQPAPGKIWCRPLIMKVAAAKALVQTKDPSNRMLIGISFCLLYRSLLDRTWLGHEAAEQGREDGECASNRLRMQRYALVESVRVCMSSV
jgi:hypothetical protein